MINTKLELSELFHTAKKCHHQIIILFCVEIKYEVDMIFDFSQKTFTWKK